MKYFSLLLLLLAATFVGAQDNRYCPAGVWTGGASDGPAALPQQCLNTSIASTPSPGAVTPAGTTATSLMAAYAAAQCGDTLVVPHGTVLTFNYNQMTFPAKGCDNQHWITIKSDGLLPAEGTRVNPAYAPQMFKIVVKGSNTVNIPGDHIRWIGVELAPDTTGSPVVSYFTLLNGKYQVFDRLYLHGVPGFEVRRGIMLTGSSFVGVVESYFSDFHCIAVTGTCTDSQTIAAGDGSVPGGVWSIKDNYLEAAGENILFGGTENGSVIWSDIEIRANTITKQVCWNPVEPCWTGPAQYVVKNLFELKNAQRLLFEGNTLSYNWGGFSQVGEASVFTPRGTWAAVQDITYRYNTIAHVGSGWQIGASQFQLPSGAYVDSVALQRLSFHDNTISDVDAVHYAGSGWTWQLTSGFTVNAPLNNVFIARNVISGDPNHTLLIVGESPTNPVKPFNITITNNVVNAGIYPVWSQGGVNGVCSVKNQPLTTFTTCWTNWTFAGNTVIIQDRGGWAAYQWPAGNTLVQANSWTATQAVVK